MYVIHRGKKYKVGPRLSQQAKEMPLPTPDAFTELAERLKHYDELERQHGCDQQEPDTKH